MYFLSNVVVSQSVFHEINKRLSVSQSSPYKRINRLKPSKNQKKLVADSPLQFMFGASCSTSFNSTMSFTARNVEIRYL